MANEFIIKNGFHSKGDSQVTGSLNVSSTLTVNGSAVGAAFPFTGDASITGSLIVSGSTPLTIQGGTENADTVLLVEEVGGVDLLTVKGDGEVVINNANNGLTGKLSFGNGISDGFIYMQDSATGPSSKYSIPQRTSNNDSSLQFWVGNTAGGPKLFPHKDTSQGLADRSVIEINLYNSGNNSRGLDFIVGGSAVTTLYQHKLWRFFSWDGINDPDSGNVERLSIGNSPLTTGGDAEITISASRVGIGAPSPSASLEINPPSGSFPSLIVSGSSEFIGNISGSATSTASFGTYSGDGSGLTNLPASSVLTSSYTSEWVLGADGTDNYTFSGPGLTGAENDPDVYLVRGQKYRFYNNSGGHPFRIQSTPNGSAGTAYNDGVTNNDAGDGTYLLFDVQFDAPTKLYYQCTSHANMGGPIYIADENDFRFTGDAQITGSLTISGSFTAFTLDSDNVVLGANTGTSMLAGADRNVILGTNTGNSLTTGDSNILIGDNTGGTLDTESNNIMMGYYAGGSSNGGSSNVYIGVLAGRYGSGANNNVAIGYGALTGGSGNTGDYNTAIGYGAGGNIDNGTFNNFLGYDAGGDITTGTYNTILGPYAGNKIVDGSTNITIGHLAGAGIVSGNRNIVIGYSASVAGDASEMLVIGSGSLATISASLATGDIIFRSTASAAYFSGDGSQLTNLPASSTFPFTGDAQITGSLIVSGSFNSFIWDTSAIVLGEGAGTSLIKGGNISEDTVIIGSNAANNLTYTDFNTVVGANAGRGLAAHQSSTFLGSNAGRAAAASKNTTVGADAGYYASGQNNAYLGYRAGYGNSSNGNQAGNVAIGAESLYSIYTGDYNIGIGYKAGYNISTGTGNIIIGSGSLGETAISNQLRIGNADLTVISASLATGQAIGKWQRPIHNHTTDFSTSGSEYIGGYNIVGGNVTCSIATGSMNPGAEFEFFQTSSAGNMLFVTASAAMNVIVKNDNLNLAGQGSGASLKYISGTTFHLVGDLT